ncbi:efflux RND transporter periplasmic adaptor subunit [Candidatus Sumerlaeota bacterium]|nr:efflux RND transporter periplasmic adaptor subunit [Candidatus Sumerlaeota bacterium]
MRNPVYRHPNWPRSLAACGVAALCAALLACRPPEGQGRSKSLPKDKKPAEIKRDKPFLTPVLAKRVRRGEITSTIATTGSIVPYTSRLLRSEEAGRLHFEKQWREGDFVAKGTRIATIAAETLENDIERAKSDVDLQQESLNIGKKTMDSAVREYQTLQDLYSRGIAALKDVDASQLSMERAVNSHRQNMIGLDKSKAALKSLQDRLERLEIVAPFDGLVVARTTLDGSKPFAATFGSETITDYDNRLISSDFPICGFIDTSRVLLRCDLTSRDVGLVRLDQEASAVIYANQDLNVGGKVVEISKSASADTRAFVVDVLVENPERILKPGMFGRVDIITERRRDAIALDKDMITKRNNKMVVFVAEKGADVDYFIAREKPIEVGLEGRDKIEVTWGLKEGDAVITRGFEVLQDKAPLSVIFPEDPVASQDEKLLMDSDNTTTTLLMPVGN